MGEILDALVNVVKLVADAAVELSDDMPLHERKMATFRLYKDGLSDIAKVLTPSEITGKQWQNVTCKFAPGVRLDSVIGLIDTTTFGSAKNGYLFTDECIYYLEIFDNPKKIWYDDIENIQVISKNKPKDCDRSLVFQMKDGREIIWTTVCLNKTRICDLIMNLIDLDEAVQNIDG